MATPLFVVITPLDLINITFDKASNTLVISLDRPVNDEEEDEDLVKEDFVFSLEDPNKDLGYSTASLVSSTPLALDISDDNKTLSFTVSYTGTFDGDEELRLYPAEDESTSDQSDDDLDSETYLSV